MSSRLDDLAARKEEALHAGSRRRSSATTKGKMTAPSGSTTCSTRGRSKSSTCWPATGPRQGLEENRPYNRRGGHGLRTIDGRRVLPLSQDFTVFGGALGEVFAEKIHKVMDLAASIACR